MRNVIQSEISSAVAAARSHDRQSMADTLRELANRAPDELLSELFTAVDTAADGLASVEVPATDLLPDKNASEALLRAVVGQDRAAITDWAKDYSDLVTGLVALLAALPPLNDTEGSDR